MATAAAVVFDASAALEVLLPDTAARFALAVDLLEQIGSNKLLAHVPLALLDFAAVARPPSKVAIGTRRSSARIR